MISFLGTIFNAEEVSLDVTVPDLTEEKLDGYPHRTMVTHEAVAPVGQVWLLSDDATFAAVPRKIVLEAMQMILDGIGHCNLRAAA